MTELSPLENAVLELMPATSADMAEALDTTTNAVRARVSDVRDKLGDEAVWRDDTTGLYHFDDPTERPGREARLTVGEKAVLTRTTRKALKGLDKEWSERLAKVAPLRARPVITPEHEDVVIHVTDDHFGDRDTETRPEDGRKVETFNTEIAVARVERRTQRALDLIRRQREVVKYDTCHYVMTGDMVTGDGGIYDGQQWDVESSLRSQINTAAEVHLRQIVSLAEEFDHVQVVMVRGNHGEIRIPGSSPDTNADEIVYDMIEFGLRSRDVPNVSVIRADGDQVVFLMRGHRGFATHGQHLPKHASTNASRAKWYAMLVEHGFDVAYAGHYHNRREEDLHGRRIMWSGSIKPGGAYAHNLGLFSRPAGTIHGVSDSYPITWSYPIYYSDAP